MQVLKRLMARLGQWLRNDRATRYPAPPIVAYYWDGGVPCPHPVKDISITGAYLYGANPWQPGTVIIGTFSGPCELDLTMAFRVVRQGPDGIGISFVPQTKQGRLDLQRFLNRVAMAGRQKSAPARRV
ncbi:MAG TPA: PilZ domain-containing protein [Bryobacteraceae bacterium]